MNSTPFLIRVVLIIAATEHYSCTVGYVQDSLGQESARGVVENNAICDTLRVA